MNDETSGPPSGDGSSPSGGAGSATATAGGVSGTHPTITLPPILIGPSTGAGRNTVRSAIIPVACWRVEDLRFEFDSSIIRPDMRDELAALAQLRQQHPGAPLSVFGHADPVGNDDYNKILSGRRATALYALLIRDTALWDRLYTSTQGTGDNWHNRIEPIIQAALGQPAGTVPAGRRQALFRQYMDFLCGPNLLLQKTDFIGQGADANGKGDFQGCSEFNPSLVFSLTEQQAFDRNADKTERNAENAPNRRVMVLLFRAGTQIDPTKWPCPRAGEGVAGCRRRFFSDGDRRRANQANRREFATTRDTFGCRFYDRLTNRSPCEVNPPQATATVEFILDEDDDFAVDNNDPAATFLRIGLWDHAFDCANNTLFNDEQETNNFVGADSRRFYLRVRDTVAGGSVRVNWRTLQADASTLNAPADQSVTLTETGQATHVFVSKALMLVTDNDDANQATHSGLPVGNPNQGERSRGEADFRIRRANIQGFVEAEYAPAGRPAVTVRLPVFERNPESRRTLPVQIFVLRVAAGGDGVIPTDAAADVWNVDLRQMRETYGRLGISVQTVVGPGTDAANIVTVNGDSLVLIDPPAGINPGNVSFNNEATLGTRFPGIANTVRMFYCGGLQSGNRGEAWPDTFAPRPQVGAAFSNQVPATYNITHEVGHILTNKDPNGGHYNAPRVPANNRFCNDQNLMRNGTSVVEGVLESKRLYDAPDRDNVNQFTSIRRANNRFLRPFAP